MSGEETIKNQAQSRFAQFAQGYIHSETHAQGTDLTRLVELAQPQADWLVLDIATGGGHTALNFAPHTHQVIASDLTPTMLFSTRDHLAQKEAANVLFAGTDAENLAFRSGTFDLVTCRIAPHHFPDCFRFVQECARVLKPGGKLLIQDQLVPDDRRAARYIDAFERLRDPSHIRIGGEYEWRGMVLDAGLQVDHTESIVKSHLLMPWAQRQGCSPQIIQKLQVMLVQAPEAVKAWMRPQYTGTDHASFEYRYIILLGHKPA